MLNLKLRGLINFLLDKNVLQGVAVAILAAVVLAIAAGLVKSKAARRLKLVRRARRYRRRNEWCGELSDIKPPVFIGRLQFLQTFREFFAGETPLMNLYAPSGRGKTTIVRECAASVHDSGGLVAFIDCKKIRGLGDLLRTIISQVGSKHFPNTYRRMVELHEELNNLRASEFDELLCECVETMASDVARVGRKKLLLVLDSFEQLEGSYAEVVLRNILLPKVHKLDRKHEVKILLTGWNPLCWGDVWKPAIHEEVLPEFDTAETRQFLHTLTSLEPNDETVKTIHDATNGEPFALQVFADLAKSEKLNAEIAVGRLLAQLPAGRFNWFVKNLLARSDEETLRRLRACAVPRTFDYGALAALLELDEPSARQALLDITHRFRSFIWSRGDNLGFQMHDRARGALLSNLIGTDDKCFLVLNCRLVSYYERLANSEFEPFTIRLEHLYHLLAVDQNAAWHEYNRVRFHVLSELRRIDFGEALQATTKEWARDTGLEFKGHIRAWIRYGDAGIAWRRNNYDEAERICNELSTEAGIDPFLMSRILDTRANCAWNRDQESDEALKLYEEGRKKKEGLLKTIEIPLDKAEIELSIADMSSPVARILELRGELCAAEKWYSQAEKIYVKYEKETVSLIRTRVWLARNARKQGHWSVSDGRYNQAIEFLQAAFSNSNPGELAWALSSRAALFKEDGRWDDAEQELTRTISVLREAKEWERLGVALIDLGDVLRLQERPREAVSHYREAESLLHGLGKTINDAHILFGLAEATRALRNGSKKVDGLLKRAEAAANKEQDRPKAAEINTARAARAGTVQEALSLLHSAKESLDKTECGYYKTRFLVAWAATLQSMGAATDEYQELIEKGWEASLEEPYPDVLSTASLLRARYLTDKEKRLDAYVQAATWAAVFNKKTLARLITEISRDWTSRPTDKPKAADLAHTMERLRSSSDAMNNRFASSLSDAETAIKNVL